MRSSFLFEQMPIKKAYSNEYAFIAYVMQTFLQ